MDQALIYTGLVVLIIGFIYRKKTLGPSFLLVGALVTVGGLYMADWQPVFKLLDFLTSL